MTLRKTRQGTTGNKPTALSNIQGKRDDDKGRKLLEFIYTFAH